MSLSHQRTPGDAAGGLTYPTTNGTNGQVLTSDGAGNVTWQDSTGGGGASVTISDTPPACLLYTSPSPRDKRQSRMPSSA